VRRNPRQAGFSLVSLAVSTAVIAVALMGTTMAVATGANLTKQTTRRHVAARAVSSVMEEVRATDFADLVANFDKTSHEVAYLQDSGSRATANVTVENVDNGSAKWDVYRVAVVVRFESAGGLTEFPVVTYVSDRTEGSQLSGAPTQPSDETVSGETTSDGTSTSTDGTTTSTDGDQAASSTPEDGG
jgi:hypothetical protein